MESTSVRGWSCKMPWTNFPDYPCVQGHRLASSLLHLHVSAPFHELWLCPANPLVHALTLCGHTTWLPLLFSSPGNFPACLTPYLALPPFPCPLPSLARQRSLGWLHGNAHCRVLQGSGHSRQRPSPSEGHSST